MKRFIAVASLAVLAAPALAAGLPYEQNEADRALPAVSEKASAIQAPRAAEASVGATLESGVWAKDHNFIAPAQ